jgi:predicted dinucleotide-binding enzyme
MTATPASDVRVVVVGGGKVARALGANLHQLGHEVGYAVRSPDGPDDISLDAAADEADLTILAVAFDAVVAVVPRLGLVGGAVLVDATNPFGRPLPDGAASGAEVVAAAAGPEVRVVKAFNVLGVEHMADPPLPDGARPLLPVAGDDDEARSAVVELAIAMGFDAVDVGGLDAAGLLEEAARYWGLLAFRGGLGRDVVLVAHHREGGDAPG